MRNAVIWALLLAFVLVGCQLRTPASPTPVRLPPTASVTVASPTGAPTSTSIPSIATAVTADTPTVVPTVPPTAASASPTSVPAPVVSTIPSPPARDPVELHKRLGGASAAPAATPAPASDAVGSGYTFWVANQTTHNYFQMPARVVLRTDHTVWYVQDGVNLPDSQVSAAANYFETQTYPTEHRLFGSEAKPGTPARITILVGHIPDVGGYFSSADEYPREVNPYSNQRKMIYINVDAVVPGGSGFNHTVAHEFMHMIQFSVHPDQNSWIDEGSAELAALAVTGIPSATLGAFERAPQTQLNAWATDPGAAIPHYGASYLFMLYVSQHFGGFSTIGHVIAESGRDMAAFAPIFQAARPPTDFNRVFSDWVAANVVNNSTAAGGRFGYQGLKVTPVIQAGPTPGQSAKSSVVQFGTRYYRIQVSQPATLVFKGAPTVQRIGADPRGSPVEWWSNRGDSIDTTLTREVDLRSVTRATLHFSAWYDIEDGYDYAYVETSTDGGQTWKTLPASTTTTDNPSGQNFGNGLTGESGGRTAQWADEQVDLSSVAGKLVLLRFEYVTDDAYNGDGLALDEFAIPEIGWTDSGDTDVGWVAAGFVRIDNREVQPYLLEVIDPAGPTVDSVPVGPDGSGSAKLQPGIPYVVAVAGLAPLTTHGTDFSLEVR
ncbi:MAG TPA: hypothetical protein VFZ25_08980 [Chloroflexota bacterium]|nr:hypothetical protein [Chloroflexota bacterium]